MARSSSRKTPPAPPAHLTPPCGTQPNTPAHHAVCPGFDGKGRACECRDARCPHVIKARAIAAELAAEAVPTSPDQLDLFGAA